MNPRFLRCRVFGHSWDPVEFVREGYMEKRRTMFGIRERLVCLRCGCERSALISPHTGKRLTSYHYKRPEGYNTDEAKTRSEWHAVLLTAEVPTRKLRSA